GQTGPTLSFPLSHPVVPAPSSPDPVPLPSSPPIQRRRRALPSPAPTTHKESPLPPLPPPRCQTSVEAPVVAALASVAEARRTSGCAVQGNIVQLRLAVAGCALQCPVSRASQWPATVAARGLDGALTCGEARRRQHGRGGCHRSVITAMVSLFTAADSDDICTAIRFINSQRP
ncbi:hypothetical protein BRADI_2g47725v3, partial [Brachypodium distachyon]